MVIVRREHLSSTHMSVHDINTVSFHCVMRVMRVRHGYMLAPCKPTARTTMLITVGARDDSGLTVRAAPQDRKEIS